MLDRLEPPPGERRRRKRVGRGRGSGLGKTAGRGAKGQGHRSSGRETPLYFEGGQMPLARRLPKRGFHSRNRVPNQIVNLATLAIFGEGASIDAEALRRRGLIGRTARGAVKVLAEGDAPRSLTLRVQKISAGARRKVEEAGGTVEIVE